MAYTDSKVSLLVAVAALVSACGDGMAHSTDPAVAGASASIGQSPSQSEAVADLVAAETAAWTAKDATAYAAGYSEDAVHIGPTGIILNSREAIRAQHAFLFSGPFAGSTQTITVTRVQFLTGTIAIVDQSVALTGYAFLPGVLRPTEPGVVRTIVRWVIEKRGGTWEIVAHQMTAIPPAA
jgi:uncharacterized protein (TIGR02246 family)